MEGVYYTQQIHTYVQINLMDSQYGALNDDVVLHVSLRTYCKVYEGEDEKIKKN